MCADSIKVPPLPLESMSEQPKTMPPLVELPPEIMTAEVEAIGEPGIVPQDYFGTAHLQADLKGRSVRGGMVTLSAQALKFGLNMASTMALARLLLPAEFGVVAMVSPVTGFIGLFKDLGLSIATVQKEKITHEQVSTLFWVNVSVSAFLVVAAAAISPLVGWFYGDYRTAWLTLALASVFIFGGLTAQHQALLSRQMQFVKLVCVDLAATTLSVAAGIIAASPLLHWSYWSLVIMTLVSGVVNCAGMWIVSPWRPGRPVKGSGVRSMLRFGSGMTLNNLINFVQGNADKVILGRVWGAAELGIYTRGFNLLLGPLTQLYSPINAVLSPTLCRIASDHDRLRAVTLRLLEIVMAISIPIAIVTMVCTDWLVHVVLGSHWDGAVPIARVFGLWVITIPLGMLLVDVLVAKGRADVLVRLSLLTLASVTIGISMGIHWGGIGVAMGIAVLAVGPTMVVWLRITCRAAEISGRDLWDSLWAVLLSAVLSLGTAWGVRILCVHLAPLLGLLAVGLTCVLTHGGVLAITGRFRKILSLKLR